MLNLFRPAGSALIRRRLYSMLLTAGMAGLFGMMLTDQQRALPATALPAIAAPQAGMQPLTQGSGMDGFGCWSPDGKQIAFMRDGRIWTVGAGGEQARALTKTDGVWDSVPAWRPDGKLIAFARFSMQGEGAQVVALDTLSGAETSLLSEDEPLGHLAWAPSGASLYYTTPRRLMRFDLARGKPEEILAVEEDWEMLAGGLAITRDGKRAVFGAGPRVGRSVKYDLWAVDLTAPRQEPARLTKEGGIMPAFDPSGRLLAYRNPRQSTGIYLMEMAGHTIRQVINDEPRAMYFHPDFSPDGKRLLVSRLVLEQSPSGGGSGGRFTSHLYLHTLTGSGGN